MLISLKINNCLIYNSEVEFSMQANMHYKRFQSNVYSFGKLNILKTAILIGPNNSGKTNFVRILSIVRQVMLNQNAQIQKNLFTNNPISEIAVSFLEKENEYLFEFKYDNSKKEFVYERFAQILRDKHTNVKENTLLIRDTINETFSCVDENLIPMMKVASKTNILIHLVDTSHFPTLDTIRKAIISFASKIDILDMNNIPIKKTIDMLKLSNTTHQKIVNFILNADLYLDDYCYLNDDELKIAVSMETTEKPQEAALSAMNPVMEMLHLSSVYKGISVPSVLFDSTGTKKIAAIASYVIDAIENKRILLVDELDNSLHFKLTRAIIAMFNNEYNTNAQLIATVHDVSLLDCQTLFRKEQIWFSHKDRDNAYLYSLAEFKSDKDGARSTSDLIEKYRRGVFGALPEPDLFKSLLEQRPTVQSKELPG